MTAKLKKSETLEIRLPYPTKLAFMARCQADGRSASEALRGFIDGEIDPRPAARPQAASGRLRHLLAGALVAAPELSGITIDVKCPATDRHLVVPIVELGLHLDRLQPLKLKINAGAPQ